MADRNTEPLLVILQDFADFFIQLALFCNQWHAKTISLCVVLYFLLLVEFWW